MGTLSPEFTKELLGAIDRMRAFPVSVQNILKLTGEVACAPRDLVEVIDKDPIVTIKVLKVVNSAYYGLPRQITSIDHAVVLLGFNTIKNLALGIAALSILPSRTLDAFDSIKYQRHSLIVAGLCRNLGSRFPAIEPHDFFIAGLLHDFGKVVLAQVMPAQFQKSLEYAVWHEVSLHSALMEVTGINHAEVGAMLLEQWRFPAPMVQAIRTQYETDQQDSPLALCVFVANQISKKLETDFAESGAVPSLPPAAEQLLGATLPQLAEALGDVSAILDEARQFSAL